MLFMFGSQGEFLNSTVAILPNMKQSRGYSLSTTNQSNISIGISNEQTTGLSEHIFLGQRLVLEQFENLSRLILEKGKFLNDLELIT